MITTDIRSPGNSVSVIHQNAHDSSYFFGKFINIRAVVVVVVGNHSV